MLTKLHDSFSSGNFSFVSKLLEWISEHEIVLAWTGGISFLMFVASLVAIPLIIAYMPEEYFVRLDQGDIQRRPVRKLGQVLKNIVGAVFLVAGLLMLILPGQGLLTMVIGLSLVDFPGKHRLQLKLIRIGKIRRSIAWIRMKAGRKPLLIPDSALVRDAR